MARHELINIDQITSSASESFPGPKDINGAIDLFDRRKLGRGLIFISKKDAELGDFTHAHLFGYALPVNRKQTEHVVFLETGDILVITPKEQNETHITDYQKRFGSSEFPYLLITEAAANTQGVIAELSSVSSANDSRCILRNDNEENLPEIKKKIDQALKCSVQLRSEAERAKDETLTFLLGRISGDIAPYQEPKEEDEDDRDLDF